MNDRAEEKQGVVTQTSEHGREALRKPRFSSRNHSGPEDQPLDPPDANTSIINDEQSVWTWHAARLGDELLILRFYRAVDDVSHAILIDSLDWQTGTSKGQKNVPLGIETIILSAPTLFGWTRDTACMSVENQLLGFDAASEQSIYRWL